MVQVSQKTLDQAISAIPNQDTREALAKAVTGDYELEVHCLSKKCRGKLLGYLGYEQNGKRERKSVDNGIMRLRPKRFDGQIGVVCGFCGQDSRLAKEEKGIVGAVKPTDEEFVEIANRLRGKKPYEELGGEKVVDGFKFVRL